jgi:hypothetical protein
MITLKLNLKKKIFLFSLSSMILFLSLALLPPDKIKEIQYKLIFNNFLDERSSARTDNYFGDVNVDTYMYPDTNTIFFDSLKYVDSYYPNDGYYVIRTIESSYYSSPGFIHLYLDQIVGANFHSKDFESKFLKEIGLKPFTKTITTADKKIWPFWSGAAIEQVFNKYYAGPNSRFQQVSYGFIYDIAAKKYMRDYIKILNFLLVDKKQEWLKACNNYYNKAIKEEDFRGSYESYNVANELLGTKEKFKFNVIDTNYLYIPLGELMRRQVDNSLPSIIKCIKRILKDYDPEALKSFKVQ